MEISSIIPSSFLNLRMDSENENDIVGLMASIRRHGLLQPLLIRASQVVGSYSGRKFELVCGHRRYQACRKMSLRTVPCIVKELSDQEALEVALTENIQRKSFTPIEEAEAFKLYVSSFGRGSVTRLAEKIGKSEEYVSHRMLLLGLPHAIKERISRRLLKASEATELLWLKDSTKQAELAEEITKKALSFRQVRVAARIMKEEDVSAGEAVRRILQARVHTASAQNATMPFVREDSTGIWPDVGTTSEKKDQELVLLNRAILVMRTSLSGLDFIVEQTDSKELRELLMSQRNCVHRILDELVREKVRFWRQARSHRRAVTRPFQ